MYQNIWVSKKLIHIWDDQRGHFIIPNKPYAYIKDPNGEFLTIYGNKVKKITHWTKWDADNGHIFESDVNPATRTLVDLYYKSDDISVGHKIIFFDIEVDDSDSLPDIRLADKEITAVSLYDQASDQYFVWILDRENRVTYSGHDNIKVSCFDTERDLLSSFLCKWEEISPTIVTGWNIDGFDIPYIYRRLCVVLGIDKALNLSSIREIYYNEYRERYFIAGISCLDYIELYKRFTFTQLHSYSLDTVSKYELGRGKIKYEKSLADLFRTDIRKFIEYSLVDTQLVVDIDKKMNLIDLVRGICHKGHVPLEDVYFSSRWIEGAILTFTKRRGFVSPNKNPYEKDDVNTKRRFSGAYVKAPRGGKYHWLYDLDFTSLYPSLIMTLNISPETKIGKVNYWNPNDHVSRKMSKYETDILDQSGTLSSDEFNNLMLKNTFSISANGIIYRQDKMGIIPMILEEWYKDKNKYDSLMKEYGNRGDKNKSRYYKDRRTITKTMLNSVYGVLGLPSFRFYDVDNAEAVTTTGVLLIKFAEKMAGYYYKKTLGNDYDKNTDYCVYIDTDSLFLLAEPLVRKLYPNDDVNIENILEVVSGLQNFLNLSFEEFSERFLYCKKHHFNIKQEVIAKTGIWTTKKRYALHIINDNGISVDEIDVKGLDVKRSNFPLAFREFLKKLLWDDFLKNTPKEDVDKKILEFKNHMKVLPLEEIATPTGCGGIDKYANKTRKQKFRNWKKGSPAHVKAAISYNEMIKHFGLQKNFNFLRTGDKIKWVYLKPNFYGLDAIAFRGYDDPPQILDFIEKHVHYKKIFEKVLIQKLKDFYMALNWGFPAANQKVIDEFFK